MSLAKHVAISGDAAVQFDPLRCGLGRRGDSAEHHALSLPASAYVPWKEWIAFVKGSAFRYQLQGSVLGLFSTRLRWSAIWLANSAGVLYRRFEEGVVDWHAEPGEVDLYAVAKSSTLLGPGSRRSSNRPSRAAFAMPITQALVNVRMAVLMPAQDLNVPLDIVMIALLPGRRLDGENKAQAGHGNVPKHQTSSPWLLHYI